VRRETEERELKAEERIWRTGTEALEKERRKEGRKEGKKKERNAEPATCRRYQLRRGNFKIRDSRAVNSRR
jgi:hypothetical protein